MRSPSTTAPQAAQDQTGTVDRQTGLQLEALGHRPEPVLRARAKCLDCSGGSAAEVADCVLRTCPLFPFRLGRNPWRAPVSEARRASARKAAASLNKAGTIPRSGAKDGVAGPEPQPAVKSPVRRPASAATTGAP